MRLVLSCLIMLIAAPGVMAAPVTMRQVMHELSDRGAESIEGALVMGSPFIAATLDDQGLKINMAQCEGDDYACKVVNISTCRRTAGIEPAEVMEIANSYNDTVGARGGAFAARDPVIGHKVCIRLRIDLHEEDVFDLADIFDLQLAIRDLRNHVEEKLANLQVRDLLGITP